MGAKGSEGKGLTAAQQVWLEHLQRCEAQGCSSVAYARAQGLSVKALYAARRVLTELGAFQARRGNRPRPGPASVTLVPVRVAPAMGPCEMRPVALRAPEAGAAVRVLLPNGVILEVPESASPERCQALAGALVGVGR